VWDFVGEKQVIQPLRGHESGVVCVVWAAAKQICLSAATEIQLSLCGIFGGRRK
jgi:hypothetical protein